MQQTVLVFVFRGSELLLIEKKRGQGKGYWNVPGGKLEPGETLRDAAIRECKEESGVQIVDPLAVGRLEFYFEKNADTHDWDNHCEVFIARESSGALEENDEARAFWLANASVLPLEKFWPSDRFWIPKLLACEPFWREYYFGLDHRILKEVIKDTYLT